MDTDFQDNMCNLIDVLNNMDLDQPDIDELAHAISLASDLQRAYEEMS